MATKPYYEQRKQEIDDRQETLIDRINLANAEQARLNCEYEGLLEAEEVAIKARVAKEAQLHDNESLVKLRDVPNKTWISLTRDPTTLIYFDHPDGAYSYCVSPMGQLTHINLFSRVYVHEKLDLEAPEFPASTPGQYRTS